MLLLVDGLVDACYCAVETWLAEDGCDDVIFEGLDCAEEPPVCSHFGEADGMGN